MLRALNLAQMLHATGCMGPEHGWAFIVDGQDKVLLPVECCWVGGQRRSQHRPTSFQPVPQSAKHKNQKEEICTICTEERESWFQNPTSKAGCPVWFADKLRGGGKGGSTAIHGQKLLELLTQAIASFSTNETEPVPKSKWQRKRTGHKPNANTGGNGKGAKNSTDYGTNPPKVRKEGQKKESTRASLGAARWQIHQETNQ